MTLAERRSVISRRALRASALRVVNSPDACRVLILGGARGAGWPALFEEADQDVRIIATLAAASPVERDHVIRPAPRA